MQLPQLARKYKCIIRLQLNMITHKNRSFRIKYSRLKKSAVYPLIYYFIHAISRSIVYINAPLPSAPPPPNTNTYTRTRQTQTCKSTHVHAHSRRKIATRVHVVLMKNDILRSFVGYSRIPRILKNSHVPCPSSITRKNLACIFIDKQPTRLIASAETRRFQYSRVVDCVID